MISLLKQPKCKSEQMSPSLLKNWFATATILSSFSVNCQCFLRGLSPVFRTMSPITSTAWKASWMLTTSIHLLQSMHCYSTCSELYAWSVSEINAQAQWKSFCSVIIHHHTHPWRPRGGQSGQETRRDKSFQAQARLTAPGSPRIHLTKTTGFLFAFAFLFRFVNPGDVWKK